MNLYFGVTIAPYAVDFCNALNERFNCRIFHREVDVADLAFDPSEVQGRCRFPFERYAAGWGWRSWRGLVRLIRDEKPEYVFTSEFSLTTLRVCLIRFLLGMHFKIVSICDDSWDMIRGNDFSRFHRWARHVVPRMVDQMILANPQALQWYRRRYGKGLLMPILADEKRLRNQYETVIGTALKRKRQMGLDNRPIVLFVGRLIPLKNLSFVLKMLKGRNVHMAIVGDGPLRKPLEEQALSSGQSVVFAGRCGGDDLAAWFAMADVLVLPSVQEAFGAVTGEALTFGCPVIVSERAGSSFLVKEGVNGSIVNPLDEDQWRRALDRWIPAAPDLTERPRTSLLPLQFESCLDTLLHELCQNLS